MSCAAHPAWAVYDLDALRAPLGQLRRRTRPALLPRPSARGRALTNARTHASFEDVKFVAPSVLRHRIILDYNARVEGLTTNDVVASLLDEVPFQASATPKTLQPTAST